MSTFIRNEATGLREAPAWGAVVALSLCVATLIASEFMPVSLLTPIATDLSLTEGQAGQAIAVSGIFAVVTSLTIAAATPRLDRRTLLLALTVMMLVSSVVVASAPNYAVLMLGRALVGVVIGGFWSLSAATVMRLVPPKDVPKGLAILNGGNAFATTVAAPLGSFMGQYIGWRGAFFSVVPLAVVTLVWLLWTLPAMPNRAQSSPLAAFRVLRRPTVALGMGATALFFMGQFTLFTYLRPFLETVTRVDTETLSLLLLVLGVAGLVGTFAIGFVLRSHLHRALVAMPLVMAVLALGLVEFGASLSATAVLLAFWGLIGTAAPVGWGTWLTRTLPNDAEAGGGLQVAVIQLAITAGATCGGWLFDAAGHVPAFTFAAFLLIACAAASHALGRRAKTQERRTAEGSLNTPMGSPHAGEPFQSPPAKEAMPC